MMRGSRVRSCRQSFRTIPTVSAGSSIQTNAYPSDDFTTSLEVTLAKGECGAETDSKCRARCLRGYVAPRRLCKSHRALTTGGGQTSLPKNSTYSTGAIRRSRRIKPTFERSEREDSSFRSCDGSRTKGFERQGALPSGFESGPEASAAGAPTKAIHLGLRQEVALAPLVGIHHPCASLLTFRRLAKAFGWMLQTRILTGFMNVLCQKDHL
jgi:hypothetical protein